MKGSWKMLGANARHSNPNMGTHDTLSMGTHDTLSMGAHGHVGYDSFEPQQTCDNPVGHARSHMRLRIVVPLIGCLIVGLILVSSLGNTEVGHSLSTLQSAMPTILGSTVHRPAPKSPSNNLRQKPIIRHVPSQPKGTPREALAKASSQDGPLLSRRGTMGIAIVGGLGLGTFGAPFLGDLPVARAEDMPDWMSQMTQWTDERLLQEVKKGRVRKVIFMKQNDLIITTVDNERVYVHVDDIVATGKYLYEREVPMFQSKELDAEIDDEGASRQETEKERILRNGRLFLAMLAGAMVAKLTKTLRKESKEKSERNQSSSKDNNTETAKKSDRNEPLATEGNGPSGAKDNSSDVKINVSVNEPKFIVPNKDPLDDITIPGNLSLNAREPQNKASSGKKASIPLTQESFECRMLPGGRPYKSPLDYEYYHCDLPGVLYTEEVGGAYELNFRHAGPHLNLHFNPPETTVAIVTCGGLCPGLNDVIRSLTMFALEGYKVKRVIGIRYGYLGLMEGHTMELTSEVVRDINRGGGSFLGSARGYSPENHAAEMVTNLDKLGVDLLFCVGGDGTQKGALALTEEVAKQGKDIGIIGIPKTIDNDVAFVQRTFGFQTGVDFAVTALRAAQYEARSQLHGVCILKLDGRCAGFVTAHAAVAFGGAHIVLIPEDPVDLDAILKLVDENFRRRKYCVVAVAVGFGASLGENLGVSPEGQKLGDVGEYLRVQIDKHMSQNYNEYTVRYIDPSYLVRSRPANPKDASFCLQLANNALHEGMHGVTGSLIGSWNDRFTCVPIELATSVAREVDLNSDIWQTVREITVAPPLPGAATNTSKALGVSWDPQPDRAVEGGQAKVVSSQKTMEDLELSQDSFKCLHLPGRPYPTPLQYPQYHRQLPRILYNSLYGEDDCLFPEVETVTTCEPLSFEHAGPHSQLHFNPDTTTVAIVTCGGLCPGLNDVVRALTLFSSEAYQVKCVIGVKYGYLGLMEGQTIELTPDVVRDINRGGGSFLGSSRGYRPDQYAAEMVKNLEKLGVNILFCVGGDGTQKGALILTQEIAKQGKDIAVIGIPKTIDNDVAFVQRTFGFQTGVEFAVEALKAAQYEARSQLNGVCIVKLDGRCAGFVTAQAAVSFGGAHIVLIPESPQTMEEILALVDENFKRRKYCVIAVAVGFGASLGPNLGVSPQGKKLGDVGEYLKLNIEEHMKGAYSEYTVRYIDPSYLVRSRPANSEDAAFCLQLANNAVHEGMNGTTGSLIGSWNDRFTVVPIELATSVSRQVDLNSDIWTTVKEITVQLDET